MDSRITGKRFKSIAVIASAALIVGAFIAPADAKTKTQRTVRTAEATYHGATIGVCYNPASFGCAVFWTTSKEKYVSIEIADTLQTTVYARVFQPLDGWDSPNTEVASICGRSEEPIRITPGVAVKVFIWGALLHGDRELLPNVGDITGPVDCPGAVSSGTIKMTFSNLP